MVHKTTHPGDVWWKSLGLIHRCVSEDVTQQVRIVESHGKKAAILQLLHEAGLMMPGAVGSHSEWWVCYMVKQHETIPQIIITSWYKDV